MPGHAARTFLPVGGRLAAAAALALAAACGGGGGTPSSPSPDASAATITITSSGVSPRAVTVPVGSRVTFVNSDSRPHEMSSDPHPDHTNCPAINQVGLLQPNQGRQTGAFATARTCGFHDHLNDTDTSLQGTITIQ